MKESIKTLLNTGNKAIIAFTNIIFSLSLVSKFGIMGVAFGVSIPLLLGQTICIPIFIRKYIRLRVKEYLSNILGVFIKIILFFTVANLIVVTFWRVENWFDFVTFVLMTFIIYIPAFFWGVLDKMQRDSIWNSLKTLRLLNSSE